MDAQTEQIVDKKEKKKKADKKATTEESGDGMSKFFEELAEIKEKIVSIRNGINDIKNIHDKALNNVISEQQNARMCLI